MSNSEPSQPDHALSDDPPKCSDDERPSTPNSETPPPKSSRSSIRPARTDWPGTTSDRPLPSPMVVVYSGENAEESNWDAGVPSERPTYTNLAPAPQEREEEEPRASGVSSSTLASTAHSDAPPQAPGTPAAVAGRAPKKRRIPLIIVSSLALSLIGLALVPPSPTASTPQAQPVVQAPLAAEPVSAAAARADVAKPSEAEPPSAPTTATTAVAEAPSQEPTPAPEPTHHRHVTVELSPSDARLLRRGARVPGPPYVVEVPEGKRITLEVTRRGYVKRKLVLDGKKGIVSVSLEKQVRKASAKK